MRRLVITILCMLLTRIALAEAPTIFWASDPVRPDETVLAVGEAMGGVTSASMVRMQDSPAAVPVSFTAPKSYLWRKLTPTGVTPRAVRFVVPKDWIVGVYACKLTSTGGESKMFMVNAPNVWWLQGDAGVNALPGGWLRVFGKSLHFSGISQALLRNQSGKSVILKSLESDCYALRFALPARLPTGPYTVFIHNGTGGNAAWAHAGVLNVESPQQWATTVFNVMDFYGDKADHEIERSLGKFNPSIDRTEAIQAALDKAKANGGGVVYLPAGSYTMRGEIHVPRHTIIRGEGMGQVTLWWGKSGFALDGGSSERRLDDATLAPQTLISGDSYRLENLSLYFPREYTTAILAGDNFAMNKVRIRVDRYWIRSGQREDGTTVRMGNNARITDCDILAKGIAFSFDRGHGVLIAHNKVMAGKSNIAMERCDGMIVEDNTFISLDPTAYINLSNEGRNVYYTRNHHESMFAHQSDFSWTFDGGGVAYQGTVAKTDGLHLTLTKDPTYPEWAKENSPLWHRAVVCVINGRGTGQYRLVTSNWGREWQIDRPFDVTPNSSSIITIIPFRGRVLLLDNQFEDASWVNLGYGTSLDVIAVRNKLYRVGAFLNLGLRDPDGCLPSWYVQYLDNDIYEGHTLVQTTGDQRNAAVFSGTSTRAAVHRNTHIHTDNSGSMDIGGNAEDVLVEHCTLENPRSMLKVDQDTNGAYLRDNHFIGSRRYDGEGLKKAVVIGGMGVGSR